MKKFLMLLVMTIVMSTIGINAQITSILLKNGPKAEFFTFNDIAGACDKAQDGDTLIFTKGTFPLPSNFKVSKRLTFCGAGKNTILSGSIIIELSPGATLSSTLFENLTITNQVKINSIISGVVLKEVQIWGENKAGFFVNTSRYITDLVCEKCDIYRLDLHSDCIKNANINNTNIGYVLGDCLNTSFNYCILQYINAYKSDDDGSISWSSCFKGTATNSVIIDVNSTSYKQTAAIMNFCLYNKDHISFSVEVNDTNYPVSDDYIKNGLKDAIFNKDKSNELITSPNNYFSSENTPVGIYGGINPFDPTYQPEGSNISDFQILTNTDKKEINLKIKAK